MDVAPRNPTIVINLAPDGQIGNPGIHGLDWAGSVV